MEFINEPLLRWCLARYIELTRTRPYHKKEKQADGRYKKVYEKEPRTPWERLMESPDISEESKAELRRRRTQYNPVELNRKLNEVVEKLLKLNREKDYTENTPCQGGGDQTPAA
ncbi:MAG: hypothetical protein LBP76_10585 [Treponema sp.]|jgi:hypothetical protein|nr:hypothetical protein [Treponema sp.]